VIASNTKMRTILLSILLSAVMPSANAQTCFEIHGRAVQYRGDAYFAIWHVGTHHEFFPADAASADLICRYFDCESPDRQPALFADFTICPTAPYEKGAGQPATVKSIRHPRVVPEWPPVSAREFAEEFYTWYTPRALPEGTEEGWKHTLKLIRWDLSDKLANLLAITTAEPAKCKGQVRIDFDPFLYKQEPSGTYKVTNVRRIGETYKADVFRVEDGAHGVKPDVIAEFRKQDEHWVFVNFHYPSGSDLITVLKSQTRCPAP
jgi:hypothetical protein